MSGQEIHTMLKQGDYKNIRERYHDRQNNNLLARNTLAALPDSDVRALVLYQCPPTPPPERSKPPIEGPREKPGR
jgi:hypothetical protein